MNFPLFIFFTLTAFSFGGKKWGVVAESGISSHCIPNVQNDLQYDQLRRDFREVHGCEESCHDPGGLVERGSG